MDTKINHLFVVPLFTLENIELLGETVRDLAAHFNGAECFICLYTEESIYEAFRKSISFLSSSKFWDRSVVHLQSWDILQSFLEEICEVNGLNEGLKVKLFSGLDYHIAPVLIDSFMKDGIEVVGTNQCEELCEKEAEDSMIAYLHGNSIWPKWNAFYFGQSENRPAELSSVIVPREWGEKLKKNLQTFSSLRKCVAMQRILHQPGAGASTLAMAIMWDFRTTWKCVRINGLDFNTKDQIKQKMEMLSEKILFIRSLGESEKSVKGVGVLEKN